MVQTLETFSKKMFLERKINGVLENGKRRKQTELETLNRSPNNWKRTGNRSRKLKHSVQAGNEYETFPTFSRPVKIMHIYIYMLYHESARTATTYIS